MLLLPVQIVAPIQNQIYLYLISNMNKNLSSQFCKVKNWFNLFPSLPICHPWSLPTPSMDTPFPYMDTPFPYMDTFSPFMDILLPYMDMAASIPLYCL